MIFGQAKIAEKGLMQSKHTTRCRTDLRSRYVSQPSQALSVQISFLLFLFIINLTTSKIIIRIKETPARFLDVLAFPLLP